MSKHTLEISKHKLWVCLYLLKACFALMLRAWKHDLSKYGLYERKYFENYTAVLKNCRYGSKEYHKNLKALRPALKHHYAHNSHHPEHYKKGITEMSALDKIELLCDWRASTRRHKTGNLVKSIQINEQRFKYNKLQKKALLRDSKEIGLIK